MPNGLEARPAAPIGTFVRIPAFHDFQRSVWISWLSLIFMDLGDPRAWMPNGLKARPLLVGNL